MGTSGMYFTCRKPLRHLFFGVVYSIDIVVKVRIDLHIANLFDKSRVLLILRLGISPLFVLINNFFVK